MNDVYDTLEEDKRSDKLVVLYESNVKNTMKIKTPVGPTDIIEIEKVVQQGGTWGPIMCSNHVDKIGKKCETRKDFAKLFKKVFYNEKKME